ncbi:MAG: carboxyl transferase domain-containing protein [Chloroflexota bacterium]|nr:biotin/lipoyl-binding protein [Dehalococcoidia bacterium]MDW8045684.1 carboxyl transferase domain-containing protein [Chloroflexota bacterium]
MPIRKLLIANRGEIAGRVARAAAALGLRTVAVYAEDDADSPHLDLADEAVPLRGAGVSAYLDIRRIVEAAARAGCDAVHPGYGFLAEQAAFARACEEAGLTFVGPRPETLELFGDKARARRHAAACGVPVLEGIDHPVSLEEARAFLASLPPGSAVALKAVAGGGGRGLRVVEQPEALPEAFERARSEAAAAFGVPDVYVERVLPRARHLEVQVLGDGSGRVVHLGERECSLQRRFQKLVEVAPSPGIPESTRRALYQAAVTMAEAARYSNAGTFEFLVNADDPEQWYFIEANARLQVEHTVTEEVFGVDLVAYQLLLAGGSPLTDLDLPEGRTPNGFAIELRVNAERLLPDGSVRPTTGVIDELDLPGGPGIRIDGNARVGYRPNPRFDPLLLKLIVHSPSPTFAEAVRRARHALRELRIAGAETNVAFLRALLDLDGVEHGAFDTRTVDRHLPALLMAAEAIRADPLAVLRHGKRPAATPELRSAPAPEGSLAVEAPLQGTVVAVEVTEGQAVAAGDTLIVLEAMKMEHVVAAPAAGTVARIDVAVGETVAEGSALLYLLPADRESGTAASAVALDLDRIRPDLAEVIERHRKTRDEARPDAVARRRETGQRTARENIADLCDPGSFVEYGALVIAAQRRRRPVEELIERTPADGLIAGIGRVNGHLFPPEKSRCVVMAYDYTVLAGTQGHMNHLKKDRMFELAARWRLPVIFFTEGGGGRPGDTDAPGVAGLDVMAFHLWGKLSGLVPLIGINSGRCFAGNAAILGCCDVVIATENSTIGMGGPAMIEGGGLGVYRPEEVGPMSVQVPNGVVDIAVKDEAEAVRVAKQYLSYFQGPLPVWQCEDQRRLRHIVPENRLRAYDMRELIGILADEGSVLELRRGFGQAMITALIRIEGRPLGLIANNPAHLGGAIDAAAADKAARFMQLCDAFDLPILSLCDTPGIMVGPESEKEANVRHAARMFVTGANLSVPLFTVVVRKGYGLGAQAMAGGSFRAPVFTVAWPTGEFGGMGLEGAVKLGYRRELEAIQDPVERKRVFDEMVARMYEHGKALNMATHFEIDDVIDPADTRRLIIAALDAMPPSPPRTGKKRPNIDTW